MYSTWDSDDGATHKKKRSLSSSRCPTRHASCGPSRAVPSRPERLTSCTYVGAFQLPLVLRAPPLQYEPKMLDRTAVVTLSRCPGVFDPSSRPTVRWHTGPGSCQDGLLSRGCYCKASIDTIPEGCFALHSNARLPSLSLRRAIFFFFFLFFALRSSFSTNFRYRFCSWLVLTATCTLLCVSSSS